MCAQHKPPTGASSRIHRITSHLVENGDTEDFRSFRCTWLRLRASTASELSQRDLELDGPLVASENEQHVQRSAHKNPSTRVFTLVRCLPLPYATLC